MQFTILPVIVALAGLASAADTEDQSSALDRRQSNANRPVPSGSCCVANTSLKQDFCNVNGQQGKCVPSGSANCKPPSTKLSRPSKSTRYWKLTRRDTIIGGDRLTCVATKNLVCDPNRTERGREFCREK